MKEENQRYRKWTNKRTADGENKLFRAQKRENILEELNAKTEKKQRHYKNIYKLKI